MKFQLLALSLLVFPWMAHSQPQASVLSQLPYLPEEDPAVSRPGLLDLNEILAPLAEEPELNIPRQLPPEFTHSDSDLDLLKMFQQGFELLNQGDSEQAITFFRQVLSAYPEDLNLKIALADSLYSHGDHAEARDLYSGILNTEPFHFQALNNLAWLLASTPDPKLQDLSRAKMLANRARWVQPNSHHVWSTLSRIHYKLAEYREAEQAIGNALSLAQQSGVPTQVLLNYLFQRDRAMVAREATSLLE